MPGCAQGECWRLVGPLKREVGLQSVVELEGERALFVGPLVGPLVGPTDRVAMP